MPQPATSSSGQRPAPIIRIITRLNIGGPSIQAAALTDRLWSHGFETLLLHGRLGPGEGDMRYLLPAGARVQYLPHLRRSVAPLSDLMALWKIFRIVCAVRPVLVHTHMAKAGTLGRLATILYNRTRGWRAPAQIVHTYHGHIFEGYFGSRSAAAFLLTERILARFTDTLIAVSPQIRRDLVERHRIGRNAQYAVIPLGFDLAPFAAVTAETRRNARRALDLPFGAPVITTVGRLTAIKHHRLFLQMAILVASRYPAATFLIAGDGELRSELEHQARVAGIADRVRFLGWRRDLPVLYAATDVFVLTSRNEGTPVALIESMAAAVPGVATNVGGVSDVIADPGLGVLVPFGDGPALADAVTGLLENPQARCEMGQRARDFVLARYTVDRLVANIVALYRSRRSDQSC